MRYVVTHHQPTAAVDSIRGDFTGSGSVQLVVAKVNRVELYNLSPEGLKRVCDLEIWGTITNIAEVKREDKQSHILVTTDHPDPYLLSLAYSPTPNPQFEVVHSASLKARAGRIAEYCQTSIVHPSGRVAVTSAYTGSLKVTVFGEDGKGKDIDVRIREQNLLSFAFLPLSTSSPFTLALLHIDQNGKRHLVTRSLKHVPEPGSTKSLASLDISEPTAHIPDINLDDEWEATSVVGVPPPRPGARAGVMVFGEGQARWYAVKEEGAPDPKGKRRSSTAGSPTQEKKGKSKPPRVEEAKVGLPWGRIAATCAIDEEKLLVSDEYGKLYLLALHRRQSEGPVVSIQREALGEISSPSSITHLTSSYFFVTSKCGDSQLISLTPSAICGTGNIAVLDTHLNLAPISDFVVTDPEKIGQQQIVTASGRMNTGSLRVVRSGVAFEELGLLEQVMNTRSIFPLKINFDAEYHLYLVTSSLHRTTLYSMRGDDSSPQFEEVDESEARGIVRQVPTLAAGNIREDDIFVQVTAGSVVAIDLITWEQRSIWKPHVEIVCAAVNGQRVVAGLKGGYLVHLIPQRDQFIVANDWKSPGSWGLTEISCIALDPTLSAELGNYAAIGFWGTNQVKIFYLGDETHRFEELKLAEPISPEDHLPVSTILTTFGTSNRPHLLVGLGNGTISSYALKTEIVLGEPSVRATDKKIFSLGTKPIMLNACTDLGRESNIFACGDRPALLFLKNDRLTASPIKLRDIHAGSVLHIPQFPSSFIFASASTLLIGQIRESQKIDVRTISLGLDTPIRLTYHRGLRAYGVVCQRKELNREDDREIYSSSFKLFDDITFEYLNNFTARPDEQMMCVTTIPDSTGEEDSDFLVVGTYEATGAEEDVSKGRILIFEEVPNRKLKLVVSHDVGGCVYAVTNVGANLAAAINGTLQVFSLHRSHDDIRIESVAKWSSAYVASSLICRGNTLLVGDAMRAVCILRWTGAKLETLYHDYASLWIQTLESIDEGGVIGAELNNNIVTWRKDGKLERDGMWYFGEGINRFRRASLNAAAPGAGGNNAGRGNLVFCTNTGRIGIVASLDEDLSMQLSNLQRNIGSVIQGPGKVEHSRRRAPQSTPGLPTILTQNTHAVGFIDGDFVEKFLYLDPSSDEVMRILEGKNKYEQLGNRYHDIVQMLEELQRLH
ncbi:hypothetical protein DACRYDRAFT_115454 [Dacryopinax primogenitus]|uniref:DNA damage-binding protein 1 n=1 Tax=Dacryopinax primogenitus (strain DJM 731) TaxID=1858805 RepID=M5GEH0_DACPD|nr:uncharacterized protein DACRYDRAFT_115454 [Dacryopinax primogenitus]EJU03243.1 hypothetical protein DACRYDRAFT_115454 [Dacryopinax primogenitus]